MGSGCVIVTGAGGSIGSSITRALAEQGRWVIMACRNIEKDAPLRDRLNAECPGRVSIMQLDLASLDGISAFVRRIKENNIVVESLINNAGIMCKYFGTTQYGYETTIGVNFVGTYLLTRLLLPFIKDGGNIVFTTSVTRYIGTVDKDFYNLTAENYGRFKSYSRSKLATTLLTARLADSLASRSICVNAADPGVVDSGMIHMDAWFDPLADRFFRPLISTPDEGAQGALAAVATRKSGEIFQKDKSHAIPARVRQHRYASWLFEETDRRLSPWLQESI